MAIAEIVSVGTELLLGEILDTNAQFLGSELAILGVDCYFRTTVGDNRERIKQTIATALNRSDVVITSGGLGPTADDLTTECMAAVFDVPLEFDEQMFKHIEQLFYSRGFKRMPESNRKQAFRPKGADWLDNPVGSAPGIIWRIEAKLLEAAGIADASRERYILTFPGVPSELKAMWQETAREFLEKTFVRSAIWTCELKHYGIGESALAEMYSALLEMSNPSVAPYAGNGECRLRVAAKAETREVAMQLAVTVVNEIKERSGIKCYGIDNDTLESVVGALLAGRGMTLAAAESCTGGLVSKRLTDIAGSSRYIKLNATTYANSAKHSLLGVPNQILENQGAVSPECARAMAEGVRRLAEADLGLSITGIAGPDGGTDDKPVGLVYLGLSTPEGYYAKRLNLGTTLSRSDIRHRTANEALNLVRVFLIEPDSLRQDRQ